MATLALTSSGPRAKQWVDRLAAAGLSVDAILRGLAVFVPPDRREKMAAVAARRLPNVTCVLEGLYDPGNVGAIGRSAEAFGVTDFSVVALHGDRFKARHTARTSMGANKWLKFTRHSSTEACYAALRKRGCRIFVASCDPAATGRVPAEERASEGTAAGAAATGPSKRLMTGPVPLLRQSTPLSDVDWTAANRVAVVFGNEYMGLSKAAVEQADESFFIETHGFSQSLNVSVAAAIVLRELSIALPPPCEDDQRAALAEMYTVMAMKRGVTPDGLVELCRASEAP